MTCSIKQAPGHHNSYWILWNCPLPVNAISYWNGIIIFITEESITVEVLENLVNEKNLLESLIPKIGKRLVLISKVGEYFENLRKSKEDILSDSQCSFKENSRSFNLTSDLSYEGQNTNQYSSVFPERSINTEFTVL